MGLTLGLLALVAIATLLYWFFTRTYSHWSSRNVPSVPNPIPFFGHMLPVICLRESFLSLADRFYKSSEASLLGFYFMRKPAVLVRDPSMVKRIMITDFASFSSNGARVDEKIDPVLAKNPFFVEDPHKWKVTRARSTSNLTGKKIRSLFKIVNEVGKKLTGYFEKNVKKADGSFECELKDLFTRYTGEIVANAAFAIEGQCFEDNPDQMAFVNVVKDTFTPTILNGMKQAMMFFLPEVAEFFRLRFFAINQEKFLRHVVTSIIERRKGMSDKSEDYLQFCIDGNTENDIDSIIADVIIFYGDVYETSSTTLAIIIYHLSQYTDVQNKLRAHVKSVLKENNDELTFDSLKNFTYLDQVIQESMRIMPPVGSLVKRCTKPITLEGPDGIECQFRPGDMILLPIIGLHQDAKHWPDPLKFDPDRFSPENQAGREKGVYFPFGEGPRMCLGQRLAIAIMKFAIILIIKEYKIVNSLKTQKPIEIDPKSIITYAKGGLWARFEKLS